jgi:PAS domain S-box-containing protein
MIGLRTTLLLPLVLFFLAWGAYTLTGARMAGGGLLLATLALLFVVTAANVEVCVLRPLRRLKLAAQDLVRNDPHAGATGSIAAPALLVGAGELRELAYGLEQLRERMQAYEQHFAYEAARRERQERSLRELEERYLLTVERANDGIWEWDLKSGRTEYSLRWKAMLGYIESSMDRIDDWKNIMHPDDRDDVLRRLHDHLEGATPHFDAEYRLRHANGQYRWVSSRGVALRHADGKPYRLVTMDNDVHARRQMEETLVETAEGLASVSGTDFYRALVAKLSSILGTRDNLIAYCLDDPPTRVRTLAYYSRGKFWDNFEFDLCGTSCGAVIDRGEIVYVATGVSDTWPEERQYDRDSYIGVPMFDSAGKIIGHFACMDGKPMRQDLPHLAIFKIFSVRAAAEVERMLLKQKLGKVSPITLPEDRS